MRDTTSSPDPQRYGTIVVVGGGCYGSYYVRQLARAFAADALTYERLLVVDHDPACRVAHEPAPFAGPRPELCVQEWPAFFADYLATAECRAASAESRSSSADAIVPSPLMPHLMYGWLLERARERWPDRLVETRPLGRPTAMPWQTSAPDGTQYVSFAEWTCPINCIEPPLCPEIRGPRTWSMPPALRAYVAAERARGRHLAGPIIFHCRHRAYGVGMFDTLDVVQADRAVADAGAAGAVEVLVGTASHCHGALNVLAIGA